MLFKALFLDLDGTVRYVPGGSEYKFPTTTSEVLIYPDVLKRLRPFCAEDYLIFGVSNQGGVGTGLITMDTCVKILRHTNDMLGGIFKDVIACPHRPDERCSCRKPAPGMLYYLAFKHNLDLRNSLMVGDMESDRACALAAGVSFMDANNFFERKEEAWTKNQRIPKDSLSTLRS